MTWLGFSSDLGGQAAIKGSISQQQMQDQAPASAVTASPAAGVGAGQDVPTEWPVDRVDDGGRDVQVLQPCTSKTFVLILALV